MIDVQATREYATALAGFTAPVPFDFDLLEIEEAERPRQFTSRLARYRRVPREGSKARKHRFGHRAQPWLQHPPVPTSVSRSKQRGGRKVTLRTRCSACPRPIVLIVRRDLGFAYWRHF